MQRIFSQFSELAEKPAPTAISVLDPNDPENFTKEKIEQEKAACRASFAYFCRNYAYVTEPRPPEEDNDPDEEADFLAFFAEKQYQSTLDAPALALLWQDLAQLTEEKGYSPELKFDLWEFQVEVAAWLEWLVNRRYSGAIEKCRDMGMSWIILWFIIWCWLFRPGFQALVGSRKEAAVDNGKLDSLFGKLDYGISKLPSWLQPKGYDRKKHRTKLSIVNPELAGNFIAGDSQTEDFGRGGRYTIIFLDEYAFWTEDVWGSCKQATKTIIAGSTVNGQNQFWELTERLKAISKRRVLTLEWHKNPNHSLAWFKQQQAESDEATFAREVLIDYRASVKGKYYPIANKVKLELNLKWLVGKPGVISMDYGVGDECALIWWQKTTPFGSNFAQHRMMFAYANNGKPILFYIPFLRACHPDRAVFARNQRTRKVVIDRVTKKPKYLKLTKLFEYTAADIAFIAMLQANGVTASVAYRGDPAGRQRNQVTATSVEQTLEEADVYVDSFPEHNTYKARRDAFTDVLLYTVVNVSRIIETDHGSVKGEGGAWDAFNAISQAKYPARRDNSQSMTAPTGPVHDWTSHYRSAGEYYAVGEISDGGYHVINLMNASGDTEEPDGNEYYEATGNKHAGEHPATINDFYPTDTDSDEDDEDLDQYYRD